ncbi:DUF1835 domain-containing protein [Pontibacter harenae]|uniref:DUF1835 domain-containing protein n=1 Tax=Pontibacter harenae TaxID=2894083 RepID=UPI001E63332D|nr:DUF1835 domain-containing protein [Pontibacter harenae]MCC9165510.1 DUF1835 domain-containing protein [Pontibacter harenae]
MKKLSTLHILNGDASLKAFKEASIPGHVMVWREVLSEGPAIDALPEKEFWERRQKFISSAYSVPETDYKEKVLDELQKLETASSFFEVVLWFDRDMMCQINLLYILHRLHQKAPNIVSICSPPAGQSIALKQKEELGQLFENRQQFNAESLAQAHQLWKLYAGPNPLQLQAFVQKQELVFPAMQQALRLHFQRFTCCTNGLSSPQQLLLQLVCQGYDTEEKLMQQFWKEAPGYGYGDWQIQLLVSQLQPTLIIQQAPFKLTTEGTAVLQQQSVYTAWLGTGMWLGGVMLKPDTPWCFDAEEGILISRIEK